MPLRAAWRTGKAHAIVADAQNQRARAEMQRNRDDLRGGMAARPAVSVPERPGIYLAGDWVGPEGSLVDASFASAREAAHAILAYTESRRHAAA